MLFLYNSRERTVDQIAEMGYESNIRLISMRALIRDLISRDADLVLKKVWDLGETSILEFVPLGKD